MATDNCKEFITSISEKNGFSLKAKWKRIKKYNSEGLTLREFKNELGDIVCLSEDSTGNIMLVSIDKMPVIDTNKLKLFSKEKLIDELLKLSLPGQPKGTVL